MLGTFARGFCWLRIKTPLNGTVIRSPATATLPSSVKHGSGSRRWRIFLSKHRRHRRAWRPGVWLYPHLRHYSALAGCILFCPWGRQGAYVWLNVIIPKQIADLTLNGLRRQRWRRRMNWRRAGIFYIFQLLYSNGWLPPFRPLCTCIAVFSRTVNYVVSLLFVSEDIQRIYIWSCHSWTHNLRLSSHNRCCKDYSEDWDLDERFVNISWRSLSSSEFFLEIKVFWYVTLKLLYV